MTQKTLAEDKTIRLLVVTHRSYPTTGGLERHVFKYLSNITEPFQGVVARNLSFDLESDAITPINDSFDIQKVKSRSILGDAYPFPTLRQLKAFIDEIREYNPDIIHTHGRHFISTWVALIWGKLNRKKLIHTDHGAGIFFSSKFLTLIFNLIDRTFISFLLRICDQVTTVSYAVAEYIEKYLRIKGIKVIYNFVDPIDLDVPNKSENPEVVEIMQDNRYKVLFMYRLVESKGYLEFMELAERFINDDRIVFIMAGNGPGEADVNEYASKNSVNFKYLGNLEHKDALFSLRNTDLVINLSAQEGLPTTIMEAMYYKRDLLITNIGPNVEVIQGYNNALAIDRNVDIFYTELEKLLDTPYPLSDLEVPEKLTLVKNCELYLTMYRNIL